MGLIQFFNVTKIYQNGVQALLDVNLEIEQGEFVFLVGPSGAGKTSFLRLLFREEVPTKGQILLAGKSIIRLKHSEIAKLRRNIGVVFQDFRLLENRTAYGNVAFAMEVLERESREIKKRVPEVLEMVGLKGCASCYPHQLSGGEQQRVAIARAVINAPRILVADEPTGNLDQETATGIMNLLANINSVGTTIIMATHNREVVDTWRRRVLALDTGRLVRDEERGLYRREA